MDLYLILSNEFPEDLLTRQKRGSNTGDIVQKIRTPSTNIDMPIVYDNKQSEAVQKRDIEKAVEYKRIHATKYVLIVGKHLPQKDVPNGLFGERDGVFLVHPSIVVEVSRTIRNALIDIQKQTKSMFDRETKESKLYQYVRSPDFCGSVTKLHETYRKMSVLQDSEERAHSKLWKDRKSLQSSINKVYEEISSGIDSILQEIPLEEYITSDVVQKGRPKRTSVLKKKEVQLEAIKQ